MFWTVTHSHLKNQNTFLLLESSLWTLLYRLTNSNELNCISQYELVKRTSKPLKDQVEAYIQSNRLFEFVRWVTKRQEDWFYNKTETQWSGLSPYQSDGSFHAHLRIFCCFGLVNWGIVSLLIILFWNLLHVSIVINFSMFPIRFLQPLCLMF